MSIYGGLSIAVDVTDDHITRLVLKGELDLAGSDELRRVLENIDHEDLPKLVVDTTDLVFIDSTGLGVLIELRNELGPAGFSLVPGEATLRVLDVSGTKSHLMGDA